MRVRIFLLSGAAVLIAAAFGIQACGNTEETPAVTGGDAGGGDVKTDTAAKVDTGPPVEEDAATCDTSSDFTKGIPDAAIGDSGSTTGICLGCAKGKCGSDIKKCNEDCPCQGLAAKALDCYQKSGGKPQECIGLFQGVNSTTQQIGFGLFGCLNSKCKDECATESFQQDAGDGG